MATITGTSGNNTLIGTDQDDTISGLGGDDVLQGLGGLDIIHGGSGIDTVDYRDKTVGITVALDGSNDVTVFAGGVAEDTIGQIENVYGGSGDDNITGDSRDNILLGGIGNDVLDGGGGIDTALYSDKTTSVVVTLSGAIAATVFVAGVAEDTLSNIENVTGGSGDDILTGDDQANILRGEIGNDVLNGGNGNDTLIGGAGNDTIDGGTGIDAIDLREKTASVVVTLDGANAATVFVGGVAEDTVRNVENIVGGSAGDTLIGDGQANKFSGAKGNDWLRGGDGADTLDGGEDSDTADYSDKTVAVAVALNGSNNVLVTVGGVVEDIITKIENLVGGSAADMLTGDAAANTFRGGAGADTLDGGTGIDTVDFSDKSESVILMLNGATDAVATIGGISEDVVRNFENIIGGSGDDQLTGDAGNNVLVGNGGADTLDGGAGIDIADYSASTNAISVTLNGANNATVFVGGVAEDTLRNIETVLGGSGNDRFAGDSLVNVFDGGAGSDTVDYSASTVAMAVTLNGASNASVIVGGVAQDTVRNIENVTGGAGSDTITGDAQANILLGGGGGDIIKGAGGNDVVDGGIGSDTVDFTDKAVAVTLMLAGAADAIATVGGIAEDTVRNVENIFGGSAADVLTGDGSNNVLRGGGGADTLDGGAGLDTADYRDKTTAVVVTLDGANAVIVRVNGVNEDSIRNFENIFGGSAGDTLTGDGGANVLSGNDGNDLLKGGLGNDVLDGGNGVDTADYLEKTGALSVTLNGTTSATVFVGGVAEDTIRGIENIFAGSGDDTLIGDGAANLFRGALGADVIDGGAGLDTADYREKTQSVVVTLNGATNTTVTVGGVAEDTIRNIENINGGKGADTLTGDDFANVLSGIDGNDFLKGGLGNDVLDGGNGVDTADYLEKTGALSVTLNGTTSATVFVGGVAEDTIRGIENIFAGSGDDTLIGDGAANLFQGALGADVIDGGAGLDTADYREKTQSVVVTLNGAIDATVTVGGVAEDTIRNIENINGGAGADTLTGDAGANVLSGNDGNDMLKGGLGNDVLDGGNGVDTADYLEKTGALSVTLNGTTSATVFVGGVAEDTIRGIENIFAGSGDDTLIGDGAANVLSGNDGNDLLKGGLGNDVLDGGNGVDTADYRDKTASVSVTLNGAIDATVTVGGVAEDTIRNIENINGGAGADTLTGDAGANVLSGNDGNDMLKGGLGNDVLDGGNGVDTADYLEKTGALSVTLNGTTSATVFVGGVAEDTILGIENIFAGSGDDTLIGDGAANLFRGALGADVIDGGAGLDTADYREKTQSVVVTLNGATNTTVTVGGVAEDTIRNIENINGGKGADTLTGDDFANVLSGIDGNDFLKGGLGNDVLDGGNGVDTADYRDKTASVSVTLNGASNATVTIGGAAEDTIRNIENLWGGSGDDTLFGDAAANLLSGGGGNDQLLGGAGADRFQFDFALGSTNVDTVMDFTSGDKLALARSVFASLSTGALPTVAFFAAAGATEAQDANQRIVYDTATGALYYDADGNASGATATQFAVLATHPALAAGDFVII